LSIRLRRRKPSSLNTAAILGSRGFRIEADQAPF
jgi:hypothetical protein